MDPIKIGGIEIHRHSGMSNVYQIIGKGKIIQIDAGVPLSELRNKPDILILTHCHYDHVFYANQYESQIWASEKTKKHVEKMDDAVIRFQEKIGKIKVDKVLKAGDKIKINGFELGIIETPGHTDGSICLHNKRHQILLSGDTLFHKGHGRTDLPSSNEKEMERSLERLQELGIKKLLPGHGKPGFSSP